ncbi:hypothetical protein D3C84_905590 [compost metagenome]
MQTLYDVVERALHTVRPPVVISAQGKAFSFGQDHFDRVVEVGQSIKRISRSIVSPVLRAFSNQNSAMNGCDTADAAQQCAVEGSIVHFDTH